MENINSIIIDGVESSNDGGSNRLWIILLILLAIIIGFWIGFFVNEYFYQGPVDQFSLADSAFEATEDQITGQQDINEADIIFQEQNYGIGETITLSSDNECLENLDLIIGDIQDNITTFQIDKNVLSTVFGGNQSAAEAGEIFGEFEDLFCLPAQSLCGNSLFDYCFYMTHEDGVHYFDYSLMERRAPESLNQFL